MSSLQIVQKEMWVPYSFRENNKLIIHSIDAIRIIPMDRIELQQGDGNYTIIYLNDGEKGM